MSIREKITLEDRQYIASWKKIDQTVKKSEAVHRKATDTMSRGATKAGTKMSWLGTVTQKVGQAMKYALGGLAVAGVFALQSALRKISGEQIAFNSKMTQSLAIMGEVNMATRQRMERTAREVARNLNISADKVAESYFFLASAGLDVEQQISALPAVAEFAKAGMFDLATATDLATDAQSALGLTVKDAIENEKNLVRVTDVLVKANTLANATVQQFSESLTNKAGAALKIVNKDIEEGVAVLSAYADQGVKGQLAGNALNIVLRDLQRTAQDNTEEFEKAGVTVFETNGEMANMADIIGDLEDMLKGLTTEQKRASLSQLGFQERSLIFLQTLLGTSDAIARYETNLRKAGGITKEVAEKQLGSLQERMGLLWEAFKNTFGPALLDLMDNAVSGLEMVGEQVGIIMERLGSSPTQRLLSALRSMDGDKKLIARLEVQLQKENLRELEADLQQELEEVQVNIGINEKSFLDNIGDVGKRALSFLDFGIGEGWWEGSVFGEVAGLMDTWQNFDFETEGFDAERIGEYADALGEAEMNIVSLSERIANSKDMSDEEREVLSELVTKYKEQIQNIQSVINKYDTLEEVRKSLRDLEKEEKEGLDESALSAEDLARNYKEVELTLKGVKDVFLTTFDPQLAQPYMDKIKRDMATMQSTLMSLQNQADAGIISEEQFEQEAKVLEDTMLASLQSIYQLLKQFGLLTPEIEQAFSQWFKEFKKDAKNAEKQSKRLYKNLRNIADLLDTVGRVADQFEIMSDGMVDAIDASADLIRNLSNIVELQERMKAGESIGALQYAIPALGVLSAGVGLFSSIFGGGGGNSAPSKTQEEIRELQRSIEENRRALERNTEALLNDAVVASSATQTQLDRIQELLDALSQTASSVWLTPQGAEGAKDMLSELQQALAGAGIDIGVDLVSQFEDLIESGVDPASALRDILGVIRQGGWAVGWLEDTDDGLRARLQEILDSFGDFGESLNGAIAEFEANVQFGGMAVVDALDIFIERLSALNTNIPDEILAELKAIDPTTEEGQKALDRIIKTLFEGQEQFMGDLTPQQYTDLLNFLQSQGGAGSGGSGSNEFTRSVQIARSITEIQANEVVALLHSLLMEATDIRKILAGEAVGTEVLATESAIAPVMSTAEKDFNININIDKLGTVTSGDIDYISQEIRQRLKEELEYKAF